MKRKDADVEARKRGRKKTKRQITVRIDEQLMKMAKVYMEREDMPLTELFEDALRDRLGVADRPYTSWNYLTPVERKKMRAYARFMRAAIPAASFEGQMRHFLDQFLARNYGDNGAAAELADAGSKLNALTSSPV